MVACPLLEVSALSDYYGEQISVCWLEFGGRCGQR